MTVTFDGPIRLAEGVWRVKLTPREAKRLSPDAPCLGARTIIAVRNPRELERGVVVERANCHVFTVGSSSEALLLDLVAEQPREQSLPNIPPAGAQFSSGDQNFLDDVRARLPSLLAGSERLLQKVRQYYPQGGLVRKGERYVEDPDNFWTVCVQPKARSLAFTVRGEPEKFESKLEVKRDRRSYSRFKVEHENEIPEAIQIILKAERRSYQLV